MTTDPAASPLLGDRQPARPGMWDSTLRGDLGGILGSLRSSLAVSTYQSGRIVLIRNQGDLVNTHLRSLRGPMGMAYRKGTLAVGTHNQVKIYRNLTSAAANIEPAGSHDACLVPMRAIYTGDLRIHDVAWAGGELWAVATRFSHLVTFDAERSFVPRWKPPFVTALTAEDRCHLNGLCVVDDEVRYVTALGVSDTAGGWREDKARGGVIMDVTTSEIIARGLSMPHSPRWHEGQLWFCESGEGSLARVDPATGEVTTIASLPGFTRGLSMVGPLAFVGLSQVRESSTFGGLPLTSRLDRRQSGLAVVHIETGEVLASLAFDDQIQEIFEVTVLPGMSFPELAEDDSPLVDNSFYL